MTLPAPRIVDSPAEGRGDSGAASTVARAADILLHFTSTRARDLGVTEIADALSLSKTAVHRILTSLRSRGLVELDPATRRYSLGVAAMQLGMTYLDRLDVRRLARSELEHLSATTNETATLSLRSGWTRAYVDQVTPQREVIMSVTLGESVPLHAGASSKTFLAFLPDSTIEDYLATGSMRSLTDRTVTDPGRLRRDLARIRRQGWASSTGERKPGAASIAAPVLDHTGAPAAVISVCGPAERLPKQLDAARDALLDATARLSLAMGWRTF